MATGFHDLVKADGSTDFPAESGRYHLYVALICPYSCRALAVRKLKGLENVISISILDSLKLPGETFKFSPEKPGCTADEVNGATNIKDLYFKTDPNFKGRFSVPLLWDKKKGRAVNNESIKIMRMLNKEFNAFCPTEEQKKLDLSPVEMKEKIEEVNDWVNEDISKGVYKVGLATTQKDYDQAVEKMFSRLDEAEDLLSKHRYLLSNQLTESDICLFQSIVRFDVVYVSLFKCNKKMIREYPNLQGFICDVYQTGGIDETVNMDHIKNCYWMAQTNLNPSGVVPVGPHVDFSVPHGRDKMQWACWHHKYPPP